MAKTRAKKPQDHLEYKILSEHTWAKLHQSLQKGKDLARSHATFGVDKPRMNRLLKYHFEGIIPINSQDALPYYVAFVSMSKNTAADIIPGFNKPIGSLTRDGQYQSVLDIYDCIAEATADGWNVSQNFVARSNKIGAPEMQRFLHKRGYDLGNLIKRAQGFKKQKDQLEAAGNTDELHLIEEKENTFKASLKNAELKRRGKEAFTKRQHLNPILLKQGIIQRATFLCEQPTQDSEATTEDQVEAACEVSAQYQEADSRPILGDKGIPDYGKARDAFALFPSIAKKNHAHPSRASEKSITTETEVAAEVNETNHPILATKKLAIKRKHAAQNSEIEESELSQPLFKKHRRL